MPCDDHLIDALDSRFAQFIGLGATSEEVQRLLDNWHIISALARGRLASVFEEFVPVEPEKGADGIDWLIWEEKLRHFPVLMDNVTSVRERLVRAGMSGATNDVEPFLADARGQPGAETVRLKIIRNRKAVSDISFGKMLNAKLLRPARLPHLLEFAAQFPDSVTPNLFAAGTRQYLSIASGQDHADIPCIRKAIVEDGGRRERMTLMTNRFTDGPGGIVYPAMQTFLVVRYPLKRGSDGKLVTER